MSKEKENDPQISNQGDTNPSGKPEQGGIKPPPMNKSGTPEAPTVEEHAKKLNIGAPVFAAVMESNKWASGKRVPEAVFKKAVEGFLGAPIGGKNVTRY